VNAFIVSFVKAGSGESVAAPKSMVKEMSVNHSLKDALLSPFQLSDRPLRNRVVMASMTRGRATNPGLIPTELHVEYYRRRASAGLIMTEATWVSEQAIGSINVPGLYTDEQVLAWRAVTEAVHSEGGRIYAQVGHSGAVSHPDFFGGALPLAPSAVNPRLQAFTPSGFKDTVMPRQMSLADIAETISSYAAAAENARRAGFDGVELHSATTYLLPQFLNSALNVRIDQYGGSAANRARIVIEILEAMIERWPGRKVGVKISPAASMGGFSPTQETVPTYDHLVERLNDLPLSHLQVTRARVQDLSTSPVTALADTIGYYRSRYHGVLIANGGYGAATAAAEIAEGRADLVSFAAPFIGNPDLVRRFAEDLPLSASDRATYYRGGVTGYLDYPAYKEEEVVAS
jgi:N-ethylmaleimide reductase